MITLDNSITLQILCRLFEIKFSFSILKTPPILWFHETFSFNITQNNSNSRNENSDEYPINIPPYTLLLKHTWFQLTLLVDLLKPYIREKYSNYQEHIKFNQQNQHILWNTSWTKRFAAKKGRSAVWSICERQTTRLQNRSDELVRESRIKDKTTR